MRIPPIAHNISAKKNISFKADVSVLPMSLREHLYNDDIYMLNSEAEKVKDELKKRFPDKNDNLQIFLQALETRYNYQPVYDDKIRAFIGYKDANRARTDILKRNQTPPYEDYITLQPETIEKIKNKEPGIMKKLGDKIVQASQFYLRGDDINEIKSEFMGRIEKLIKNEMDYHLTEWVQPEPYSVQTEVTELYLPPWL